MLFFLLAPGVCMYSFGGRFAFSPFNVYYLVKPIIKNLNNHIKKKIGEETENVFHSYIHIHGLINFFLNSFIFNFFFFWFLRQRRFDLI